jgi:gluconokinase
LRADANAVRFVYLKADYPLLRARLETRKGHFFDPSLLESQLALLEEPVNAMAIDAALPVDEIVERIRTALVS